MYLFRYRLSICHCGISAVAVCVNQEATIKQLQVTGTRKQPFTQLCIQLRFLYLPRLTLCLKLPRHRVANTELLAEAKHVISVSKDYSLLSSELRD